MTPILVAGAVAGLGALLLAVVLAPPRVQPGSALARLDLERAARRRADVGAAPRSGDRLGRRVASLLAGLGLPLTTLRGDLAITGSSYERHLATSTLAALVGFLSPMVLVVPWTLVGAGVAPAVPVVLAVGLGVLAGLAPSLVVRHRAAQRRRDFRHVVGSFLDLVAMSLAGGRGVPEALQSASELSNGWAMVRIRDTLIAARLRGVTPWTALGQLGEDLRVDELRDLSAALALVAEDGAKVRDSLRARAASMRRRELAEAEGRAGEKSQSMLVAQLLLAVGFLVFLVYPAMVTVLHGA
ncbi:type II secretion system F family protein [Actinotalea sp. M2MS4P-6]|uniref:type II secretion system F family protein n=1 Tax=Actinotalea sp. M2MS4P-6 TaxID=2983762 RepID=UPI0021E47FF8|nr:type II secretion system F family protein [Actinotalea sp. M2MS4P-6]MCV2394546.1 type II secretion system F family protein [Actinotalea sp. M2MS4P-6]